MSAQKTATKARRKFTEAQLAALVNDWLDGGIYSIDPGYCDAFTNKRLAFETGVRLGVLMGARHFSDAKTLSLERMGILPPETDPELAAWWPVNA